MPRLYFPSSLELKRIEMHYDVAREKTKIGRVSASTIRKWNFNFLIKQGVPESVAEFIQGRASTTVGSLLS
ncbi:MAG: integrase [Archaeoglobaceae archaeon]|nr:integrase [Archaeoglobaceae archaeon]